MQQVCDVCKSSYLFFGVIIALIIYDWSLYVKVLTYLSPVIRDAMCSLNVAYGAPIAPGLCVHQEDKEAHHQGINTM